MTDPIDRDLPRDPHEGIDAADNAEARVYEENQSEPLSRASDGGAPPTTAPLEGEAPQVSGTGAGDPLAGVTMSDADAADTVEGDEGPEHPGVRRSS